MSREKNSQKKIYILACILLLLGLGYLMLSGLQKNSVYFLNVSEALAQNTEKEMKARLFGRVMEHEINKSSNQPGVRFWLADKDKPSLSIRVKYSGAVPDTFSPGTEVIVEGSLNGDTRTFQAHSLMTKCPSKYEKRKNTD